MIHKDEGFYFLTTVRGHFQGGGEMVGVYLGQDGFWYLGGSSLQQAVMAKAMSVRVTTKDIQISAAEFVFGTGDVRRGGIFATKEGNTFVPDQTWGREVLGVWCAPVDGLPDFHKFAEISPAVEPPNRIKFQLKGSNESGLVRMRAVILFHN